MKTIVVTTDFSFNANRAAHFAIQLARAQKASLILVHAFHFLPINPGEMGYFPTNAQALYDDSEQKLAQLAKELHEQYGSEVPIRCVTKEGYALVVIRAVTEAEKADLLIMSTVGAAPQSAQLLGSVATGMVAETNVPLLLIPPSIDYADIRQVVLGIDLTTPIDAVVLDTAFSFARQVGCVVNVLCINEHPDSETVKTRAAHIEDLIGNVVHTLTILSGDDVYETLITFAHTNKADLIMMMPQAHNWFHRLFTESKTEQMARLTDIPLLAVV